MVVELASVAGWGKGQTLMCSCRSVKIYRLQQREKNSFPAPISVMQPFVSIIVPCYNEEKTIHHLLSAILAQTYPRAQMELIISDGMSTDLTRHAISKFQSEHADFNIRVIENTIKTIPSGLNQAIRYARGEFIVRLDAHSVPIREYVERCVAA